MSFRIVFTISDVQVIAPEEDLATLVPGPDADKFFGKDKDNVADAMSRPIREAFERRQKARIRKELQNRGKSDKEIDEALAVVTSDRPFIDWFLSLPWDKIIEALLRIIIANEAVDEVSGEA